jgi:triosephosphate isomerase (TIM)
MLQGLVEYGIVGHSEARAYLGETDEDVNKKAHALLNVGLKPIIAVGESRETREAGQADAWVARQVRAALQGISAEQMAHVVIAYEPIWAIGTGLNADGATAQAIIGGVVRATLIELYGDAVAQTVRIQYGGSVTAENMAEFMAQPDIDGGLVGGASLKLSDFPQIVAHSANAKKG